MSDELPSLPTLGRIIASYVQQSNEQHELRAHKALNILHQKDIQLQHLHERLAEMEALKMTVCQNQASSEDQPDHESTVDRTKKPMARQKKSSSADTSGQAYPTRHIKSNLENVSEGSTLISSSCSEETKSQPNLKCWQKASTRTFICKQTKRYAAESCAVGKVSQKIRYFERPGCGDDSSQVRVEARDAGRHRSEEDADALAGATRGERHAGIPRLDLPASPGTESESAACDGLARRRMHERLDDDRVQGLADDYVKHFLDVKLMEASIICQEMKRDAPRPPAGETANTAHPETSVLYSSQKSRKTPAASSSSESLESRRGSQDHLKDAPRESQRPEGPERPQRPECTERPERPDQLQQRRLINHLMVYNRELKAELNDLENQAVQDRKIHLAEVTKLQQCVSELKATIAADLPANSSGSGQNSKAHAVKNKSALFSRNVSSQTDDCTLLQADEASCCPASERRDDDEEARITSRTTQTDTGRRCFCCTLGDSEVPPQWLLAEALARVKRDEPGHGAARYLEEAESPIYKFEAKVEVRDASSATEKIYTKVASTQVDLSDSKAKNKKIEDHEKEISALKRKVEELNQYVVKLGEKSRRQLDKERRAHQREQLDTEKELINFCNFVAGGVQVPCELFAGSTGDEKSVESSSGNSSAASQRIRGRCTRRVTLAKLGSRWDVLAARRYVKKLKTKLKLLKSSKDRAEQRIAECERSIELKDKTQGAMEKCVEDLLDEVSQLRARCQAAHQAAQQTAQHGAGLEDGTDDGGLFAAVDKLDKSMDNSRTQNVHTRLRNTSQQLAVRSKALQNLQQELKETQNNLQNTKNRLSRSENLNQNKQLIIENYKRRLEEIVSKEAATANRNSGLTTENHHLKDVTNNLKKQISQLRSGKCQSLVAESEVIAAKSSETISSNKSVVTMMDVDRIKCDFNNQMELANLKFQKSERRASEFLDTLERFLRLAQAHFAAAGGGTVGAAAAPAPRSEARALACSILNLTHGQLDSMLLGSGDPADNQLTKWLEECKRIHSSETFSEKLSCYLLEVLKKMTSSTRG